LNRYVFVVSEQKTTFKILSEEKIIICKAERSEWGWGGGQHLKQDTDRRGFGWGQYTGDGNKMVGMGTKYFTVSASSMNRSYRLRILERALTVLYTTRAT